MKLTKENIISILRDHQVSIDNLTKAVVSDGYPDVADEILKRLTEGTHYETSKDIPIMPCGNCLKQKSPCRSMHCQYKEVVNNSNEMIMYP